MRSPQVVGKLSPHERVTRQKVARGYAYVKADASGLAPSRTGPSIFDPY